MSSLLWAALAFGTGIYGALHFGLDWPVGAVLTVLCLCLGLCLWQRAVCSSLLATCFLLGIGGLGILIAGVRTTAEKKMAPLVGRNVVLTGRPVPESFRRDQYGGLSFILSESRGNIQVHVKNCREKVPFCGKVQVKGLFSGPSGFYNFGLPDPHVSAAIKGIGGRLQCEAGTLTVLSRTPAWQETLQQWGGRLRQQWQDALPPGEAALLSGMVLGDTKEIPPETLQLFQRCGLSHLLAVSGSHMAILLGLLWAGTRPLPLPKGPKILFVLGILACYTVLCGLRPSVCRAFLMGAGTLLGRLSRRKADSTAFLGLAALLLLVWQPWYIMDPGFLLSFGACLGLLQLRQPITERFSAFLPHKLAQAMAVPLSAQAVTLPLIIHFFHMLSVSVLAANILLVPLLSFCLAAGGLGAVLGVLGAVLPARLALVLADQVLGFALWGGSWLARLPGTHWVIGRQSGWLLPLYFLLLAALLGRGWFSRQSGRMVRGTVLATLCSLCLLLAAFQRVKQPLTAYFLDVGQGDCAVVVTPEKEVLVVDMGGLSGHFDTGERILVPFLRYLGADKVTLALVSHGHHDHAGGLTSLLTWFPVETLCLPDDLAAPDVEKALHVGKNTGSVKSIYKVQQAQRFMLKKGALQIVEAPKIGEKAGASNETSVVVRLLHPSGRILFTGDAPGELERSAARNSIQSDVLKISHHGSKTSSDSEFLKTVRPQLAVISAGRKNKFGHPHEETLKKLKNLHIPVVRTDKQGAIKITFDEHGVWWYSYVNMNNNTVWK